MRTVLLRAVVSLSLTFLGLVSSEVIAQPKLVMDLQSQQTLVTEDADVVFSLPPLNTALDLLVTIEAMKLQNKTFSACSNNIKKTPNLGERFRDAWLGANHDFSPVLTCLEWKPEDLKQAKATLIETLALTKTDIETNSTSANDLATLTRYIDTTIPEFFLITQNPNHITSSTTSRLSTPYSLVNSNVTSLGIVNSTNAAWLIFDNPKRHQNRRLAVIIGDAPTSLALQTDAQNLYKIGYQQFDTFQIYAQGTPVIRNRLYMGTQKYINLVLHEPVWITVESEQLNRWGKDVIQLRVTKLTPLLAPITDDAPLGELSISLQTQQGLKFLKTLPLFPEHAVSLGSSWHQFVDTLRLVLKARNE